MNERRALSGPETDVSSARWFASTIVLWQRAHGRHDLPWQVNRSAYRVWLSEIMLQQTQVQTALPYFERFIARFPTVEALAAAPLESVIALWAGLGYYARARNLHACARAIVARGGVFPRDVNSLAELPGIGRSTAGAIVALAFGHRAPILDGNVKRVLSRYFAITEPIDDAGTINKLWSLAEDLAPGENIAGYTQGLMDLGASICTRRKPACAQCPLSPSCCALRDDLVTAIPARRPRNAKPRRMTCLLMIEDGDSILFERRPPSGIWGGLLSLPEAEPGKVSALLERLGLEPLETPSELPEFAHTFTHFVLQISPWRIRVAPAPRASESDRLWLRPREALIRGVPAPVRRLLDQAPG